MNPSQNDRSASAFRTTQWTQVLAARGESAEAKHALRDLCEAYYAPVEAFVGRYRAGRDDARDLTHQFFAKLLEGNSLKGVQRTRGRFRSYLLGAVKHFLSDQADRMSAEKRGSGQTPQALDASPNHDRSDQAAHTPLDVADPHGFPPDAFFDRQWALTIVEKAMSVLQAEAQDRDETQRFEVLRRWLIPSEHDAVAAEAARSLDMSEGAFKVAVHRLRKRFRQLVKDQIASSVDGPESLQEELDYLIQALTASESSHDSRTRGPDELPAVDGISTSPKLSIRTNRYFRADPAQGFPPPQPLPSYSPSIPRRLTEYATAKGLTVDQTPKTDAERPRKKVQRHSPDRLLRRPVELPGGHIVSAERHRGRIMVRFERTSEVDNP